MTNNNERVFVDKMRTVYCIDTGASYGFVAKSNLEAIGNLLYTLNLSKLDKAAGVRITYSNRCYYFNHCGKTYSIFTDTYADQRRASGMTM